MYPTALVDESWWQPRGQPGAYSNNATSATA